jgi:hypothetical protein
MSEEKTQVKTGIGRLAFSRNLFEVNDKGRYSIAVVFNKEDKEAMRNMEELKTLVKETADAKWPKNKPSNLNWPLKEENREEMITKYPFMENAITVNVSNGFEFPVINKKGKPVFPNEIKAGDYVQLMVSPYAYDNKVKGVGLNVDALLLVESGEPFTTRTNAAEMFGIKVEENNNNFDDMGF